MLVPSTTSKEAHDVVLCPPPRSAIVPRESAVSLPLEQLWNRLPPLRQQELLKQLTRLVAQRLDPSRSQEAAHE